MNEKTDYDRGWSDCRQRVLDYLEHYGEMISIRTLGMSKRKVMKDLCFAVAAQEPMRR